MLSVIFLLSVGGLSAETLYQMTFDQVPGRVQTGAAPFQISSIRFGNPEVVPQFGPLTDSPLVFDMVGNLAPFHYDQIELHLPEGVSKVSVSFDVCASNLSRYTSAFTIFLDSPQVHTVELRDGWIEGDGVGRIASYRNLERFRLRIEADLDADFFAVYRNGVLLSVTNYHKYQVPETSVSSIRFSLGVSFPGDDPRTAAVAIDDLVVTTEVTPVRGKYSLYWQIVGFEARLKKFDERLRKARRVHDLERRRVAIAKVRKRIRTEKARLREAQQQITIPL